MSKGLRRPGVVLSALLGLVLFTGCTAATPPSQPAPAPAKPAQEAAKPAPVAAPAIKTLYIGAVPSSSSGYPLAVAMAQILTKGLGITVNIEASAGGVQNIDMMQEGKVHIGISGNHSVDAATKGIKEYAGKKKDKVMGWLPLYVPLVHIVVPANSPIKTFADMKGKRINVGIKGGSIEKQLQEAWDIAKMPRDSYKPYFMAHSEGLDALKAGTLDATLAIGAIPFGAMMEAEQKLAFRMISMPDEYEKPIKDKLAYYSYITIPKGTYKGQTEDVKAVALTTIAIISKDLPTDLVYTATKAMWENLDIMHQASSVTKAITPEAVVKGVMTVAPLHPGAEKYYKEKGWIK